tara:strand:+ start:1495 stop:2130 length:636 start_codon:yes stop_codon:yes gene_type:complete
MVMQIVSLSITMIVAVMMLAASIRRLNDINVSPWFAIAVFIPYLGILAVLVLCLYPGDPSQAAKQSRAKAEGAAQPLPVLIIVTGLVSMAVSSFLFMGVFMANAMSNDSGSSGNGALAFMIATASYIVVAYIMPLSLMVWNAYTTRTNKQIIITYILLITAPILAIVGNLAALVLIYSFGAYILPAPIVILISFLVLALPAVLLAFILGKK